MKKLLLICSILLLSNSFFKAQTWTYAGAGGSANAENGKAICVDAAGNVYVTGQFTNIVDFDLGAGVANLTSNGANDIFIASYTSAGVYRWAVRAGGIGADNNSPNGGICTDGVSVYVTGSYNGAATLFGGISLTPNGGTGTDAFVAKLNCTTGAFTWAVSMGGTGNVDSGTALCLDPSGNPYLLGSFNGTMSGACGNVSLGGSDIFVSKLNPATGACVWMASGGSATNDGTLGGGICYDPTTAELIVASTTNAGLATFGAFNVTSVGGIDMCVLELNSTTGAWLGVVGSGSATTDDAIACVYDPSTTNVMVCGAFTNNMTLPGGIPLTASSAGIQDAWWGSYSVASNGFVWAKAAVGTGLDRANGITVDGNGSVLITGQYVTNPTTFGSLSLTNTNSGGFDDMFLVNYSAASGTEIWATKNTNTGVQPSLTAGRAIAYAGSNNYWITGQSNQGSTFGSTVLNAVGFADFFIAKYNAPVTCLTPTLTLSAQTNISCNGGSNGSATMTASGGSPFTYVWSPSGGTSSTATGLSAGNYTCVTTNSCGLTASRTVTITQPAALSITPISQTNISCFGGSNGAASVNASGGTTAYTYNWTPGNPTGDGTASVTGLTAQVYTCTVTDANSCTRTQTFNITQPTAIALTPASQTNISCNGGSNGAASVNAASGGAGGFTYNWTPGNPTGDGTTFVAGLTAQVYTCTVTDANSCTTSTSFNITQPTAILLTPASQTNISCNGGSNGAASVNAASGGAGGFTYNWTPGNPTGDGTTIVTGLTAQVYTCTVTDANSCTRTQTFNITQPTALALTPASQTNISCNGGSNGAASVNAATGGAGGYTYNWTPGNPTGDGTTVVTGLTAQVYTCTVTDANSCTRTQTFNITQPTALALTPASQTNISCNGGSNGAASVNAATGGAGGYTYNWTPGNPTGDGTTSVAGLTAQVYTCTVTDANSCTTSTSFNITQPTALALTPASQTNISCNGGSNGAASVNAATGGAGGYTYNWTPGNPTGDGTTSVAGLTAQVYTCTVTDANSCTTSTAFNITQPVSALATATAVTNISCFGGANGSATITASGGTSSYTYLWSTGATTSVITSQSLGTKSYTVTDANGCTSTGNVVISQPTQISANIGSSPTSCTGNTGSASVTSPAGGAGGYTYSWAPSGGTANTATSLGVGNYTCTVTDANSCSITKTVSVITASGPSLTSLAQTNIACFGNSTGAASVNNATGGTTPYTYNWTPGNPTGDGTTSVTGLTAQVYTCTVTDANGCSAFQNFNITQPTSALATSTAVTNVACFGNSTGAATVTASGGTSAYSYLWSTGATTSVITSQTSGVKTVTVTDANGCTSIKSVSISQPASALATATAVTNVACFGNSTGSATLTSTGGTSAYTYLWSTGATTSVIASQTLGVKTVTVSDANGCTSVKSVSISQPATALATATAVTNVTCFGNSTGAATVTASGGTSAYTYLWSTGATTSVITSQTSGVKTVTVSDANGCTSVKSVSISQPASALATSTAVTNVACFGNSTGAATVTATGGTSAYTYLWSTGATTSVIASQTSGVKTVTVTDANGCTAQATFNITTPLSIAVTPVAQTNVSCFGGSNGSASITTPTGGAGSYTYNWTPGNPTGDGTLSVTGLTAGTWTCTVTDANSCSAQTTFNITSPTVLSASSTAASILCNGNNTIVTVSASGGTTSYTGTGTFTVTAGSYTYTVADANGCTATTSITVSEPNALTVNLSAAPIACNGSTTQVNFVANGGTSPYTGTTPMIVSAGSYSYTVTDNNGCAVTETISISEPAAIVSSQTITLCNSQSLTIGTNTYTASGIYVDVLSSQVNGCDSTLTTNLTISPAITHTQNISLCFGEVINVGANTYNASGTYVDVLAAINGCDSTLTTILVVNSAIDVTTNLSGLTISANESTATYQWIDCDNSNQPIAGETNQSFTASSNGNYAVIVTQNACSDTSACVNISTVGIKDMAKSNAVNIYPNPSNGIYNISGLAVNSKIVVYDAIGQIIYTSITTESKETVDISKLPNGVYMIQLNSENSTITKKVIKKD